MRHIDVAREGLDAALAAVRRRLCDDDPAISETVRAIVADVRERGDIALLELGRRFDSPDLAMLAVTRDEWDDGCESTPDDVRAALGRAAERIRAFHVCQLRTSWRQETGGRLVGQVVRPLDRVGVYVPGGRAAYPSSVLMCAVPAQVSGVRDIVLCTPAGRSGAVHPAVLWAAREAGVSAIYKVGGAQAVAALAYGTEQIAPVDKIVGPGNAYVVAAKRQLWGVADMDMVAGPSEVCVIADRSADPTYAAADMLTQTEHDPMSAAFLLTPDTDIALRVAESIESMLATLPRAAAIREALDAHSACVVTRSLQEALELANACAPEHLALMVEDPMAVLGLVRNAGAVMLGSHTPQTVGDYLAGPSHTLPTGGTARFWSPVHVDTFLKKMSFMRYSAAALLDDEADLTTLARSEGFEAHAAAVTMRTSAMRRGE